MNDNTEVRDELARLAGWRNIAGIGWCHPNVSDDVIQHPIPNTLDEAAKLPEGWAWFVRHCRIPRGEWEAQAVWLDGVREDAIGYGDTEKEARFSVRLAVEKIEHERKASRE